MAIDVSTPKLDTVTFEDEDKVVPSGTLGTELDPLPTDLQTEQAGYNDSHRDIEGEVETTGAVPATTPEGMAVRGTIVVERVTGEDEDSPTAQSVPMHTERHDIERTTTTQQSDHTEPEPEVVLAGTVNNSTAWQEQTQATGDDVVVSQTETANDTTALQTEATSNRDEGVRVEEGNTTDTVSHSSEISDNTNAMAAAEAEAEAGSSNSGDGHKGPPTPPEVPDGIPGEDPEESDRRDNSHIKYRSLDNFKQPKGMASRFADLVHAQVHTEPNLRIPDNATVRRIGTLAGSTANEAHYRTAKGYAGIRYIQRTDRDLPELHLRTYDSGDMQAPTRHYTRYVVVETGRLLIAHEVNDTEFDDDEHEIPGTPQALAAALDTEPFDRGLITRDSKYDSKPTTFWGLVGAEEFASLGKFAIGKTI